MSEINFILENCHLVPKDSIPIFVSKLNRVYKVPSFPLLLLNEDGQNNEGRNTMYELKMFIWLLVSGFDCRLIGAHPDISITIGEKEYCIECKRIQSEETFIKNLEDAIDQLKKNRPLNENRIGVVAISITKFYHAGNLRLEVNEESEALDVIKKGNLAMIQKYSGDIVRVFNQKIPLLILDFSDRIVIDKPYTMHFIDFVDTSFGRYETFAQVKEDFMKLNPEIVKLTQD